MFLAILYLGGGIYLMLLSFGVLHRDFGKTLDHWRRMGIRLLAGGLLVLGSYHLMHSFFFMSQAGDEYRQMEERLRRDGLGQNGR